MNSDAGRMAPSRSAYMRRTSAGSQGSSHPSASTGTASAHHGQRKMTSAVSPAELRRRSSIDPSDLSDCASGQSRGNHQHNHNHRQAHQQQRLGQQQQLQHRHNHQHHHHQHHHHHHQSPHQHREHGKHHHHHQHRGGSGGGGHQQNQPLPSDTCSSSATTTNKSTASGTSGSCLSCSDDGDTNSTSSSTSDSHLPYPGFPEVALKYLTQDARPRSWCLRLITNPSIIVGCEQNTWFERVSILVILLNCITLGMYQPCVDDECVTNRCKVLQMFDDIIFAFFALEMTIKMIAMGMWGKNTYLADSWNRLDFFIVAAGAFEYCLHMENLNLTAIRTIRVLRPLRAINRIPSMRILVMLLLDTLPMLGNVLLLCFFVFFIFGIVGVQLWEGILRQRCVLQLPDHVAAPKGLPDEYRVRVRINSVSFYYEFSKEQDYICSKPEDSGMHLCSQLPPYRVGPMLCNATALSYSHNHPTNASCVNWNQYYTNCTQLGGNPFQGTISFDNIGMAWVAIFLVISLEGWTDIMYYVQDAHSFWDWIYFVLLIVIGSFFMINLCLVVIATQFSETKKREMERMRQERLRYTSTSTLASSTNNSEPATCYAEIVKYIAHLWRRTKRRLIKKIRLYKYHKQLRQQEEGLLPDGETLTLSPNRIKCHHPKCPKHNQNQTPNHHRNHRGGGNRRHHHQQQQHYAAQVQPAGEQQLMAGPGEAIQHQLQQPQWEQHLSLSRTVQTDGPLQWGSDGVGADQLGGSATTTIRLRVPSPMPIEADQLSLNPTNISLLSASPTASRRRSAVMFNDYVILHTPTSAQPATTTTITSAAGCQTATATTMAHKSPPNCSEKTTQTNGNGTTTGPANADTNTASIWQVNLPNQPPQTAATALADCSDLALNEAMTCQELLAFSVAFSAALPTNQTTLETFYSSLAKAEPLAVADPSADAANAASAVCGMQNGGAGQGGSPGASGAVMATATTATTATTSTAITASEDFSCCLDLWLQAKYMDGPQSLLRRSSSRPHNRYVQCLLAGWRLVAKVLGYVRRGVRRLVEQKYFQQGILLAILINTLSMGIEYHNQPEELTAIVETSNIVFSVIFACEMLLKVVAEGPFRYIANGFNVFDGVIVILSVVELCQEFFGVGEGNSGLSVLRTFRLLRILKLVRFMPNLRRQLFVMLRTMDNVAIFFSLLILFIFIFSILGMYLFGGKFCKFTDNDGQERECTCPEIISKHPHCECDRKHFNNILWATVTVFQILTQEDWNVVLFNGMEKTSHWAALYFVALMTFGNYVLFNLLVAILVEGFSSERNERREREQRELVKKLREENETINDLIYDEVTRSCCSESTTTSDSYTEIRNRWHSAEDLRKVPKCNIQKQRLLQPHRTGSKDTGTGSDGDQPPTHAITTVAQHQQRRSRKPPTNQVAAINAKPPNRDPPIITTTAATPQDSPSTTLDGGLPLFRQWDSVDTDPSEKSDSTPSLLRPPSIVGSFRNIQQRNTDPSAQLLQLSILPIETRSSCPRLPFASVGTDVAEVVDANPDAQTAAAQPNGGPKKSTFKRFSRSSSKKQKSARTTSADPIAASNAAGSAAASVVDVPLNNGRDPAATSACAPDSPPAPPRSRCDSLGTHSMAPPVNRIQNDTTKDINKISPQNSFRRQLATRRMSALITSNQQLQLQQQHELLAQFTRQHSLKNQRSGSVSQQAQVQAQAASQQYRRRMSSIEQAYEKSSNLNLYSVENMNSAELVNSKLSLTGLGLGGGAGKSGVPDTGESPDAMAANGSGGGGGVFLDQTKKLSQWCVLFDPQAFAASRDSYSLYVFAESNRFRLVCTWFVNQKWFDNVILLFIALNCITLAMERPNIPPHCAERVFLGTANYVFTAVFSVEMLIKVVAAGMFYGEDAYFNSGWNIMDGSLVSISIIDLMMSLLSDSSPRIFGILRVFRLLRSLRPLRVINRAPGLKLVVQTLLSSLRPIGNIVLICCTFFIIFGILGVQLFKGTFFYCEGVQIKTVRNKTDCLAIPGNVWINRKYNFDDLGKALMSLFVLSSRDGWVNIMYTGLDAVGVDQQPVVNFNEWRLLYFIAFILLVGFFVLNMFVGVVVENFHRCREEQEKEEKIRRAAKRALQMEKKRRRMHEPPYYIGYSPTRLFVHNVVTSKYFDLAIAAVIGLNVITMALEYYMMPVALEYALKIFNYFFTAVFILESTMKLVALGIRIYMREKWNQLDVAIVLLSVVGIVLEELETNIIPINPTIIRVMRVMRIARVLKLLKMAKGIRALLDTVMQALPQVGNLGLLFFLLFFIFAALGVELFGRLECSEENPCQGLGEHAHFANFGMAFLTLFRVATGDNWNGIMKDTLRDDCDDAADCVRNCCVSTVIAPIFFVIFVLMAQFVLVNVVVAVLMKHLEESHKQMEDDVDMDMELEREFAREQRFEEEQALCAQLQEEEGPAASGGQPPAEDGDSGAGAAAAATTFSSSSAAAGGGLKKRPLTKILSLPPNFTYNTPIFESRFNAAAQRRQSLHYLNQATMLRTAMAAAAAASAAAGTAEDQRPAALAAVVGGRRMSVVRPTVGDCGRRMSVSGHGGRKTGGGWSRSRAFKKEMSLDGDAVGATRRRRQEYCDSVGGRTGRLTSKRMSCDSLPAWRTSVDGGQSGQQQLVQVGHQQQQQQPPQQGRLSVRAGQMDSASVTEEDAGQTLEELEGQTNVTAATTAAVGSGAPGFLSVPMPAPPLQRHRTSSMGSCRQLFKQAAMEEEPEADENSLLLPATDDEPTDLRRPADGKDERKDEVADTETDTDEVADTGDSGAGCGMQSDSSEILRIISERRSLDRRDTIDTIDSAGDCSQESQDEQLQLRQSAGRQRSFGGGGGASAYDYELLLRMRRSPSAMSSQGGDE